MLKYLGLIEYSFAYQKKQKSRVQNLCLAGEIWLTGRKGVNRVLSTPSKNIIYNYEITIVKHSNTRKMLILSNDVKIFNVV